MPSFELLRSETILEGRAFRVRRDHLVTPDGRETQYDILEHTGSVVLIPVADDGSILFVRQFRPAAGVELLELPAGTLEEGESFESCAAREMREETGMAADHLERLGEFFLVPGYSTEYMAAILATHLRPDPLPGDADEFLQVEKVAAQDALRMAELGQITDAKSLAALLLARRWLTRGDAEPR